MVDDKIKYNEGTIRIVAVEPLKIPQDIKDDDRKTALSMFKILKAGKVYYFYDGYTIHENEICYEPEKIIPTNFYTVDFPNDNKLGINICSIVGANGAGKSSLIELMMRILNNLAAIVFGEYYFSPKAEHLHYINHLYAKLFVHISDYIFEIIVEGLNMEVKEYQYNTEKHHFIETDISTSTATNEFAKRHGKILLKSKFKIVDIKHIHQGENDIKNSILNELFYTIITNYSLYSFNTLEYLSEYTGINEEKTIRNKAVENNYDVERFDNLKSQEEKNEARCWLSGIFHKNDGYQTPIVVNPKRQFGNIDINTENELAKERLMLLVFKKDSTGKHFFKKIRGGLTIQAIKIKLDAKKKDLNYANEVGLDNLDKSVFKTLCDSIIRHIYEIAEIQNSDTVNYHNKTAQNYIIFKVLKIIHTYKPYYQTYLFFKNLSLIDDSINEKIKLFLERLLGEHSHITTKLWQTISFLKYNYLKNRRVIDIDEYSKIVDKHLQQYHQKNKEYHAQREEELLPPPIFEIDFNLYSEDKKLIPFHTLSSGQKQIIYTISTFLYHLINIDSVSKQPEINNDVYKAGDRISYRYVNAIFDEIELYFHPNMQRCFIDDLLSGLKQMKLENIKGIQIIIATHSPFILSDIHKNNILFLEKLDNGSVEIANKEKMRTWGANIHDILKHSFFLREGSMGEYARGFINETILVLNLLKVNYNKNEEKTDEEKKLKNKYPRLYDSNGQIIKEELSLKFPPELLLNRIKMIDEPIIRSVLMEQFTNISPSYKINEIQELEKRLSELKTIKEE
jgi:predicted ATP-binding protein involved in virulence